MTAPRLSRPLRRALPLARLLACALLYLLVAGVATAAPPPPPMPQPGHRASAW
nr:hypothetical protein [Stenotrophomonas acidaminiphila]